MKIFTENGTLEEAIESAKRGKRIKHGLFEYFINGDGWFYESEFKSPLHLNIEHLWGWKVFEDSRIKITKNDLVLNDSCPECGEQLKTKEGGGFICSDESCDFWWTKDCCYWNGY